MKLTILIGLTALISTVLSVPTYRQDEFKEAPFEKAYVTNKTTNQLKRYFGTSLNNVQTMQEPEAIVSGDTVALQTLLRDQYFSCSSDTCGSSHCPRQLFEGNDWNNCRGEVFKIYRKDGPGDVRSGDAVGLYYPHEESWLTCHGELRCHKSTCPEKPSLESGFEDKSLWSWCVGSVFLVFARDKPKHAIIKAHDDISLYYLEDNQWVAQGFDLSYKSQCMKELTYKLDPPPRSDYDSCPAETFTIWKKV